MDGWKCGKGIGIVYGGCRIWMEGSGNYLYEKCIKFNWKWHFRYQSILKCISWFDDVNIWVFIESCGIGMGTNKNG